MNIITYTAITNNKDNNRPELDFCFQSYDKFKDPRLNAKIYKILPHLFIPGHEWSIWVDGNVFLNVNPIKLINELKIHNKDIGVFKHTERDCLYEEARVCTKWNLDNEHFINRQVSRYSDCSFPEHNGLYMCFLIIRRNTEYIRRKCEQWWCEITAGSVRDQISFPFVFNDLNHIHVFEDGVIAGNCKWYTRTPHSK